MSATNRARSGESRSLSASAPEPFAAAIGWGGQAALLGLVAAAVLLLLTGWLYLTTYLGVFGLRIEGVELSPQAILVWGAHSLLFPFAALLVLVRLRGYAGEVRQFALVTAGSAGFLALVAFLFRWYSVLDILVQTVAILWIGLAVYAYQRGFAEQSLINRMILGGAALLLLFSLPTAFGFSDAGQKVLSTRTGLVVTSAHDLGLPGPTSTGNLVQYRHFVLIRESTSRIWLMRLGLATDVYSVAKSDILWIRY